jgi:hypothetical protein
LSYITASGGTTNINTVQLTGSLSWYANQTAITTNTTRIALFNATNISPSLIYSLGSTNWGLYVWYSYPPPPWFSGTIYNLNQTVFSPIMDMNGYSVNSTNYYILDIKSGNVDQIYFAVNGTGMTSNLSKISAYASQYNDKDPFIDLATMQVYFSSDRNGKGNFDLYRYNVKTFDKVIK